MADSVKSEEKVLLAGNEAFALGAFEAGVKVASAYPGTPSTEIMENLSKYDGLYTEWAPNEKVALEVAIGASFAGVRAMAMMKHVGVNVAADPLFTSAYTGVKGGLVIIEADDPSMHSSQNEQDNRNYALAAKLPMLEPSDAAEARDFVKLAFELSERFDTPVLVRTTTRVSHVKGLVSKGEHTKSSVEPGLEKFPSKLVMLPANARARRVVMEARMKDMKDFAETFERNIIEWGDKKRGFITSGAPYLYTREAFPEASFLKLGMVWPLPEKLIREFAEGVQELIIIEELDPFIETQVKAMGIACRGKELISPIGELEPSAIRKAVSSETGYEGQSPVEIPMRPPNMCPGCPHRGLFYALSRLDVFVSGDIGCYTLGFLPPLSAMDSCVCMGASVSMAHGMDKALGKDAQGKVVAVIGDSTFVHSGITGLIDMVYNGGASTVIILDNRTTAMTGHQNHPATGKTVRGEEAPRLDIEALVRAVGVKHVTKVNPHDVEATLRLVREEIERPECSVIITEQPCVLLPEIKKQPKHPYEVLREKCTGCRACLGIGCPAIEWMPMSEEEVLSLGLKKNQKGQARINPNLCDGCGQCVPLCKFNSIERASK